MSRIARTRALVGYGEQAAAGRAGNGKRGRKKGKIKAPATNAASP
jgi:hypothetical protein